MQITLTQVKQIKEVQKKRSATRRLASSKVRPIRLTWMEETFKVANQQLHMEAQARTYPQTYLTFAYMTGRLTK